MFRSPQPGDWAAEDDDTPPLRTPTLVPITPDASLDAKPASVERDERSNGSGRFDRDRHNSGGGRFDREGGRFEQDREKTFRRDRGDSSGRRVDRSGPFDRDTDRSGRFDRTPDRSGRFDRETDRSGRVTRDTDRSGPFNRDHGRYEGGGRADVSRWGHAVDRRGSSDCPDEQGFIVAIKETFGFVSRLDHEGDLFFHLSEAPVDIHLQDEVAFRVKYNPRSDKEMACHVVALPKGTIQVEEVATEYVHGHVTKSLARGGSRGFYTPRDNDRRQREDFGLIEVEEEADDSIPMGDEGETKAVTRRECVRFTKESLARVDSNHGADEADAATNERMPHLGDEVRFKIAIHRKTGMKRAVEMTITVSAREKLDKEVEAKLATMTRETGVVDRLKHGGGVIKCCDRPVDVYFSLHELREDVTSEEDGAPTQADGLHRSQRQGKGLSIREGEEVSFFVYEAHADDAGRSRPRFTALRVQKLPAGSVSFEQLLRTDLEGVVAKAPKEPRNGPAVVGAIAVVANEGGGHQETEAFDTGAGVESRDKTGKKKKAKHGVKEHKVVFQLSNTEDASYVPHVDDRVVFDEVLDKRTGQVKAVRVRIVHLCPKTRETGVIHTMKEEFGFIKCAERSSDAYFRFSDVMGTTRSFNHGTEVTFDVVVDAKSDHVRATRVQLVPRGTVKWDDVMAQGVEGHILAVPSSRASHHSNRGGRGDKGPKAGHGKISFGTSTKQHLIDFLPELKQTVDAVFLAAHDVKKLGQETREDEQQEVPDNDDLRIAFPHTLSKFERATLHEYSDWLGLHHESRGEGVYRQLEIYGSDQISRKTVEEKKAAAAPELIVEFREDDVDGVRYHPRVGDRVKFDLVLVKRTKQFQCKSIQCVEAASCSTANAASSKRDAGIGEGLIVSVKSEGFGFIQPVPTVAGSMEENLFFHIKEITTGQTLADLKEGTEVQYTPYFDEKKKKKRATAISVVPAGTIKTVVPERVQGVVMKASFLHRMKGGAKSRFPKANNKASTVGCIRLTTRSHDDVVDNGESDEGGTGETTEVGTRSTEVEANEAGKLVYLYNIRDIDDPTVIVREGDEVEFIPQVTLKTRRAAHIRLVTSHAKQGIVTRVTDDHGGVIRLDGEEPGVEARFTARSVLRGDLLNEGDRVEFAYRQVPAIASSRHGFPLETDEKEEDAKAGKEEETICGQALSILCLSSNRAATSHSRGSRTVNSTLKEAMRQIGANAMVASRMAKGPNGTRGFVDGWSCKEEEMERMEETAARSVTTTITITESET